MRGEGSIEFCGAGVVEAAAALVVEDVSGVFGLGDGDESQVGAAGEPPANLAVEVLDLAALPRRVRVAEPDLQVVVVGEGGASSPIRGRSRRSASAAGARGIASRPSTRPAKTASAS